MVKSNRGTFRYYSQSGMAALHLGDNLAEWPDPMVDYLQGVAQVAELDAMGEGMAFCHRYE